MKKICALLCILSVIFLFASCSFSSKAQVISDFEKYTTNTDLVLGCEERAFYFSDHTLYLSQLNVEGDVEVDTDGGVVFKDGNIYFATGECESLLLHRYILRFYKCDYYGNNLEKIFEKNDLATYPQVYANGNTFYIEYHTTTGLDESSKTIYSYSIETGEYLNVDNGENASVKDYLTKEPSDYSVERTEDKKGFVIKKASEEKAVTIDDEFLKSNVECYDLFKKYGVSPRGYAIVDGRIFLFYYEEVYEALFKAVNAVVVVEYYPEEERVEFKQIFFPFDVLSFILRIK